MESPFDGSIRHVFFFFMKVSKVLVSSVSSIILTTAAHSAAVSWTAGDGLWNVGINWSGGVTPGLNDDVNLGMPNVSVSYLNALNPALNSVVIDAAGGTTLVQGTNDLTAKTVIVGDTRLGSYVQNGGSLLVTGNTPGSHLIIGAGNGGSGSYTLTNGAISAAAIHVGGGSTSLGWVSNGVFEQTGGSVNVTTGVGEVIVGDSPGTSGLYLMKGGSLAANQLYVGVKGSNGTGRTFNHTGGTVTVNGSLALGGFSGPGSTTHPSGTYLLSGDASTQLFSARQFVGVSGTGVFTQSGGVNNVTLGVSGVDRAVLVGAQQTGSAGTYNMNGGILNAEALFIGNPGRGTFNHASGTVNVTQQLVVDNDGTASQLGRYVMTAGQLNTTGAGSMPGLLITGEFQHSGGTITANGVGADAGFRNDGTYTISGGTLTGAGTKLNTGSFTGFGNIGGTGTLFNEGVMTLAGGPSTIGVPVQNAAGRLLEVDQSDATFNASFTNRGTLQAENANLIFGGDFDNTGEIRTDAVTIVVHGNWLQAGSSTVVAGSVGGDIFRVRGSLEVTTTNRLEWDTRQGILHFFNDATSNGNHSLIYAGLDLGPTYAPLLEQLANGLEQPGFQANLAWGEVIIDAGNFLNTSGGALYAGKLTLTGSLQNYVAQIGQFTGDLKIYYDPALNPALGGQTFQFAAGSTGFVAPVPEPSTLLLVGGAVLVGGFRRWRRVR
jgi:hypothetical protein